MVSEPTPTTSVGLGVTPVGGSARAGVAARAVIAAAAVAAPSSLLTIRTFCPPRDTRAHVGPRCLLASRGVSAERAQFKRCAWPQRNGKLNTRLTTGHGGRRPGVN